MNWFGRLFAKKTSSEPTGDIMSLSKQISSVLDSNVTDLFAKYHEAFLNEPVTYVVYAIWGAKKGGEITYTQKEINKQAAPAIARVTGMLITNDMTAPQKSAIDFIVRGLVINRITYMIEMTKNKLATTEKPSANIQSDIKHDDTNADDADSFNSGDGEGHWYGSLFGGTGLEWRNRFGPQDGKRW